MKQWIHIKHEKGETIVDKSAIESANYYKDESSMQIVCAHSEIRIETSEDKAGELIEQIMSNREGVYV